jgi:cytochrome c oxidase cbb3-type subunit IV
MELVTTIRIASTVVTLLIFVAIVWWAYGKGRKSRFERAASSVLDDQDSPGRPGRSGR